MGGVSEVARMAGLIPIEDADESPDTMLADVETSMWACDKLAEPPLNAR